MSDTELDNILLSEESQLTRDKEIDRILQCFKLDSYSILGLLPGCSATDIKKTYRKKSLLIHPDKSTNKRAPDAFDMLKKAEETLSDEKARKNLDDVFTDARKILIRDKRCTVDDDRLKGEEFLKEWREKTKDLLIEDEVRKRIEIKRKQEEDLKKRIQQEEITQMKKIKKQMQQEWEDSRDARVNNWRAYTKSISKKKKKKTKVLA